MQAKPTDAPERVTLHVTPGGIVLGMRGYDTTPVTYVRADIADQRWPHEKPVEAEDVESGGEPLMKHEGW